MPNSGIVRKIVIACALLLPFALLVWAFPPYEICVRYYAKDASSSMGPNALGYAENLCERKLRFWR